MIELVADRCSRCEKSKSPGAVFYLVRMSLTADVDQELVDLEPEVLEQEMKKQMEIAAGKEEQELNDEVYQELYFYLCKPCRDWLVKHPFAKLESRGDAHG